MNDFISLARQIFAPDHGPAFRQVTSYLSRNDLKNLRLTCFTLYDIIPKYDNSFIPTLKLTEKIELGDHFFRSDNQVHVVFPEPKLFTDQMSSLVQRLEDRITGVKLSQQFLSTFKHLRFTKIQSIHVTGGHGDDEGSFDRVLSLINLNAATLRCLKIIDVELPDNIEISEDMPVLQQFHMEECEGDTDQFLHTVVKKASRIINSEDGTNISCLKMLHIDDENFDASEMSSILTCVPNLEQLTVQHTNFSDKLNLSCQLPSLRKLDVNYIRGMIPAIIQSSPNLEELTVFQHEDQWVDMYEDEDTDDESLEMNDEDHEEYEQDEIALVKRHLPNNTLKNLIIDIGEYDDEYNDIGNNPIPLSEGTLELIAVHSLSLEALQIHNLFIGNIWNGIQFTNLKKVYLRCEGNYSLLLKQCPALEEFELDFADSFLLDKKVVLPNLKKLTLKSLYYNLEIGHVLRNMPRLEELTLENCNIYILNKNFNLSSLNKIHLDGSIGKNSRCILAAKLPSTMSLNLEKLTLDDDDFFRLSPPFISPSFYF